MHGSDEGADKKEQPRRPLSFAEYAQEFLRRNPRYRAAYRNIAPTLDRSEPEREVMARRWGLGFPLPARQAGDRGACLLAAIALRDHRHSRYRPFTLRRFTLAALEHLARRHRR